MAEPMYRQIAEDLRRQIEAGHPVPGAQLKTELELRETYNASRNTIRDAIKWLISRGLVETRSGQGTFVVQTIVPFVTTLTRDPETSGSEGGTYTKEVLAQLRRPKATVPKVEIQEAGPQLAVDLQVNEGDTVVSRHQQRFIDDAPWSLQTSFYPMQLIEQGAVRLIQASNIEQGILEYLREVLKVEQAGWHDGLTARAPEPGEAAFFTLPEDGRVSVIEIRRTAFDKAGKPIHLTVSVYPADRNQFVINVGDIPAGFERPLFPVG